MSVAKKSGSGPLNMCLTDIIALSVAAYSGNLHRSEGNYFGTSERDGSCGLSSLLQMCENNLQ